MSGHRTFRPLLAIAIAGLLVSGCGSDDEASSASRSSDSSSSSSNSSSPATEVTDSSGATAAEGSTGSSTADGDSAGWTFTDDRGVTIELASRPERIVAYVGSAAVLWDFGIRPVGVFGPQRLEDGTPEPAAGNLDLDTVASVGEVWEGVNLEALAELQPDLVISSGTEGPWVITDQLDVITDDIAPVALVEIYGDDAAAIIGNYERLAVALGADVESDEIVAAKATFESAEDAVRDAVAANPGVDVLATYADTSGIYVAKAKDFPDLALFVDLGVGIIDPGGDDDYWELMSWEQTDRYPADLLIHDVRSYSLQPDALAEDYPTWSAIPAVAAGEVAGWSAEAVLSYQEFSQALLDLADAIAGADPSLAP